MTTLFWKKKFPEKSEVFFHREVKIVEAKKKAINFGPVFGVAFFGKRFEEKSRRSKTKATMNIDPPQQQLFTSHISTRIFHDTKNLYGNLKERQWERWENKIAIWYLKSLN